MRLALTFALTLALAPLLPAAMAWAGDDSDLRQGWALADTNCGGCHALGPVGASHHRDAPPFRDIANMYSVEELEDSLDEGVATEHPDMPDWDMSEKEAHQLAVFIMSLASYGKGKS
ncbi:MAG: cytochrome c [Hyphomicrobiales bacterium]